MSLGVRQLWGFWRHASLAPGVSSLIPREPLLLARNPPRSPAATAFFSSSGPGRRRGAARSLYAQDGDGEVVGKSATSFESTAHSPIDGGSKTAQNPSALFINRISKLPVRAQDTHLPVMVDIYPHRGERAHERRKLRRYLYQHRHHTERIYRRYGENVTPRDWRRILQTLLETTPIYTSNLGRLKVFIPENMVPRLATDPVDNIWEIKSRSGCEIQVHERNPDDPQDQTYLLLSGPWSAIDCAVGDFRRIVHFAHEVRVVPLAEEDAQRLQEQVSPIPWERVSPVRQKYFLYRPLAEIEKPEIWTFDSFERYITALTKSRLPPGGASQLSRGRSHTHNVVRALLRAFRDPAALPALSPTSFKHALKYLAIHGDAFWNHRKVLFDMMTSHGFEITTDVYDIMSLAALKVNDVGFFQAHVHQMAKNGLSPSLTTWIHFLRMVKVEEIRRYILHAMASKRLFDHPSAMHLVSGELIEHDIHRAIQLGFNVKSFIASQNELYGPEWLHWQTSNKVLYALGSHGKFDEINEFLTVMFQSEHARPKDEIALNIILTHCKYHRRLNDAIHFVKRFEQELGGFKASGVTFHLLSTLAWRMRKPHVLSVLWRYSYFELLTPRYLTFHFHQLLLSSAAPRHISRFTKGLRIAGVFPRPPDGRWVGYTQEKRRESVRLLRLSMENLLLRDYKKERGINPDHLLTGEEFRDAVLLWYPETFGQRKPVEKLGDLLARAAEEDRKNILDSRAGKAIILESLPIRTVRKRVDSTRTPEEERRNMGVQDRSQLDERELQVGRAQNTLDLGEHYPESGRAETHKVDE